VKIFLDSVSVSELEEWKSLGVVDGLTTNPLLFWRAEISSWRAAAAELLSRAAPLPVCVQVASPRPDEAVREAREWAASADNVVIKVPIVSSGTSHNLSVIRILADAGVPVNATACFSLGQALLAARAGASYVSLLWGRMMDHGIDPAQVVRASVEGLSDAAQRTEVVVGSVRASSDLMRIASAGAHVATVPAVVLEQCTLHGSSAATADEFYAAAKKLT
jgi:transaldolase